MALPDPFPTWAITCNIPGQRLGHAPHRALLLAVAQTVQIHGGEIGEEA